jgi:hypothetical protein
MSLGHPRTAAEPTPGHPYRRQQRGQCAGDGFGQSSEEAEEPDGSHDRTAGTAPAIGVTATTRNPIAGTLIVVS